MGNLKPFSKYALNQPEIHWLVDDLLIASGTSLLVGDPKSGKSQLVRHLIAACVNQSSFLDKHINDNRKVIYLALEENPVELKKYLVNLGVAEDNESLLIGDRTWSVGNNTAEILKDIQTHKPALCVIDTFVAFSDLVDMNEYAKVYKPLQALSEVARSQNCHILIVHHKNKSDAAGAKAIMGSQAFFAAVDTCLMLSGESQQKNLLVEPRYTAKREISFKMTPQNITEVSENTKGLSCRDALLAKLEDANEGYDLRSFSGYSRQAIKKQKNSS